MKNLILLLSIVVGFRSFASANSGQPLYHSCATTAADANPDHTSRSLKLYADATPVEVPPPPGGTSSVVVSVSDRKATLVLEGMLFTGSADSQLNLFKSDDGQVTASFSPDLQTATVKIGNRVMTFGQCLPRMSN